ncbi:Glycosyltransferase, catalytic subunit of cellulose synthase and poly-beta-1,6-N-acetylglucosamine synthase [Algoriphagus halophilus]|uniref:Glycosyltransferase, catalytic subunit of cellulose synthase and poly-beta-1,6-N-acetylglucosamine synthase n=1 Tax=Algoriphagus halophilus TaxID=226505 RepID=A0A1N6H2C9_9BACT|nr:Glycosyltransferase, catalytic subunit of cellulose synthase and poly-beta-1,6-N-acetylglucosamine synthase [Algoriphagus halophilus]
MDYGNTIIFYLAFFAVSILLAQYLVLIFRALFFWVDFSKSNHNYFPKVSVLVTSRNEEKDLPNLLASLQELDYPSEQLEFLMADDQSEDGTLGILEEWKERTTNCKVFSIKGQQLGKFPINGKANALAIMAKEAKGDFLFFTDADCVVGKNWVKEGVNSFSEDLGLLNGVTELESHTLFAEFQKIDWWNILGITKIVSDMGAHTTGLGNNMVISRKAYLESGGYENTKFSWTEDLEISRSINRLGFQVHQQVSPGMLLKTKAERSWSDLLKQRKRWLKGVVSLPWKWKVSLGFHLLFFPAIAWILASNVSFGFGIWGLKILLQSIFIMVVSNKAGRKLSWFVLAIYDFYYLLASSLTILYYFWPSKITWKSRNYL